MVHLKSRRQGDFVKFLLGRREQKERGHEKNYPLLDFNGLLEVTCRQNITRQDMWRTYLYMLSEKKEVTARPRDRWWKQIQFWNLKHISKHSLLVREMERYDPLCNVRVSSYVTLAVMTTLSLRGTAFCFLENVVDILKTDTCRV
jgi:hypothetical protein